MLLLSLRNRRARSARFNCAIRSATGFGGDRTPFRARRAIARAVGNAINEACPAQRRWRMDRAFREATKGDIDLVERVLYVRQAKTDAGVRTVVLDPRVITLIDAYVKDWRPSQQPGPLFLTNHGDPFSYDGFSQIFRRVRKRLPKSVDYKSHRGRNTGIVNWWRTGVHPWDRSTNGGPQDRSTDP